MNTEKEILRRFELMSISIYNRRYLIVIICAALLLLAGCKKTIDNVSQDTFQQYFEDNILNRDFVVELAKDTTNVRTGEFDGYVFVLTKTTSYYDGPMTATKNGVTYSGTWTSNEDYGKLVINLTNPAPPPSFQFLNRPWKFTRKSLPIMELAPWGPVDPKVLHMRRL